MIWKTCFAWLIVICLLNLFGFYWWKDISLILSNLKGILCQDSCWTCFHSLDVSAKCWCFFLCKLLEILLDRYMLGLAVEYDANWIVIFSFWPDFFWLTQIWNPCFFFLELHESMFKFHAFHALVLSWLITCFVVKYASWSMQNFMLLLHKLNLVC